MRKSPIFTITVLFFLTLSIALPVYAQLYNIPDKNIGTAMPDFALNSLSGGQTQYSNYRDGKKSIVFFWATWCPHCRKALTQLNQEKDKYLSQNIRLVLIDIGEDPATVKRYVDSNKVMMDIFLDEDSSIADQFELIGVPTFIFVNETGKVTDVLHALPQDLKQVFG